MTIGGKVEYRPVLDTSQYTIPHKR